MPSNSLFNGYGNILKDLDIVYLDKKHPEGIDHKDLSGLFLTDVSDKYLSAKNKIMIVGSETAGWSVLQKAEFTNLDTYIKISMGKHKDYFKKELISKYSKGYTFHNFTRSVAKKCGGDGLIYSNLFCFDWKKGSPIKCKHFETIKKYSQMLLAKQVEILKPDIIVFANGMTSVPYRREIFPLNKCTKSQNYADKGISKHHLWEFDFDGIHCFRIHHPSARAKEAARTREFILNLLPPA